VAGKLEGSEGGDDGGDGAEDGDFDEDLRADGGAEGEELLHAGGFVAPFGLEESVVVFALVVDEEAEHDGGLVTAREHGGPAGAGDSPGRDGEEAPVVSVDEEPVECDVDEVGRDEREGDGADVVEGLEVAAHDEPEEERGGAPVEGVEKGAGASEDLGIGVEQADAEGHDGDDHHEDDGDVEAEEKPVLEGAVGVVDTLGTEGLGENSVETEEHPAYAEG